MIADLSALIAHLDAAPSVEAQPWQEWHIYPIPGGANNLLYHATHPAGDYAIKFTVRDDHDRAGREYAALTAIARAIATFAPVRLAGAAALSAAGRRPDLGRWD